MGMGMLVTVGIGMNPKVTQAGRTADRWLIDFEPGLRRPFERLVIKARRKEWFQEPVDGQQIEANGRPAILASGSEALMNFDHCRRDIRLLPAASAEGDKRIGFFGTAGIYTSGPVIFEAAANEVNIIGNERRCQRIAWMAGIGAPIELELDAR